MEEPRAAGWGNPLSWRIADRCFAIALLMITTNSIVLIVTLTGGWPLLAFPAGDAPSLPIAEAGVTAAWGLLALVARRAHKKDATGPVLAVVTVWWYATTLAAFTIVTGPFAAPGWIAMVGGAVVGYVLFSRWLALAGCAWYVVLVVGLSLLLGGHRWAALDAIAPARAYAHLDVDEVLRQATSSFALSLLTFSVIAWVVDRWRDREARYLRLAETDALTALTNRRRFLEIAERELARSRRYHSPLALVLVDLDHFKAVNDRYGHLAGAREVAERTGRRLAETTILVDSTEPVRVTASMGVAATTGERAVSLDDLLRRADAAMYAAKRAGRDRVEVAA